MTTEKGMTTTAPAATPERETAPGAAWTYRPDVDIFETSDALVLVADVPGATAESIDLSFDDGALTLQAPVERRAPEGAPALWQEYGVGPFHRRFSVETPVDAERVSADLRDGVLTVTLPKAASARRKKIAISGG